MFLQDVIDSVTYRINEDLKPIHEGYERRTIVMHPFEAG
jgi:hypothetical protein